MGNSSVFRSRTTHRFLPVNIGALSPSTRNSELFGHEKGAFTGADKPRPGEFRLAAGGTVFGSSD